MKMKPKRVPHTAPRLENVRLRPRAWELSDHSLAVIASDAYKAMEANPDGPKAETYREEGDNACIVLAFRKSPWPCD